jgi:hypothetical protein
MPDPARVKCALCGLRYNPTAKKLPKCKSDDGTKGPRGYSWSALAVIYCVLSAKELNRDR